MQHAAATTTLQTMSTKKTAKRSLADVVNSLISPDGGAKRKKAKPSTPREIVMIDSDNEDDIIVLEDIEDSIVTAPPTAANRFVDRVVKMLAGDNDDDYQTMIHVLEVLSRMDFYKNTTMRDALKNTDICNNLCNLFGIREKDDIEDDAAEEITYKLITLIVDLTHLDKGYFKKRFASAADTNCISSLIKEMKAYSENEKLQEMACRALDNISTYLRVADVGSAITTETKQYFYDALNDMDNIQTLYDTMTKYKGNRSIHESIIAVLYVYLGMSDDDETEKNPNFIKEYLLALGFLDVIYDALLENVENSSALSLVKMCLLIVTKMAQHEKETRIFLREKEGIFTLATLIQRNHPSSKTGGEDTMSILNLALELLQLVYDNTETND